MKKLIIVFLCILSAFIGGVVTYLFQKQQFIQDKWIEISDLPLKGEESGLGYSSEAFLKSEIQLPVVKNINAKVKFMEPLAGKGKHSKLLLGYIVNIDIENFDTTKIPQKYREERKEGNVIWEPLKQVFYSCHLEFTLFDKDGFKLIEVSGPTHSIESGKLNTLQDKAKKPIPFSIIKRTTKIKPYVTVDKCVSCGLY